MRWDGGREVLGNMAETVSGIAMIGTLTSLLIPRTQPPNPDLRMPLGMVFVPHETWRFIFSQPVLRNCLTA